jgi:D-alanyl-D-alanine carboxypeptidase
MSRRPLLLVAAVAALLAAPVATASPTHAELDRAVDRVVSAGAPGVIALVRDGHRTVRAVGGLADRRSRRPLRPGDRFRVGSNTKTFVATVVLQLAGEGRLALEDTVERWLPGLVPGGGAITVRQLLNHTSGLPDYAPEDDDSFIRQVLADRRRKWTPQELVGIAMARPPLFAPGAAWGYSNTGYVLLGLIAEAASGRPLATELRRRIFAPLHLRGTTFATGPGIAGRHGHGYSLRRAPPVRHHRGRPVVGGRRGRDRVACARPRPLPARSPRRAAPAPRPARPNAHDRARRRPGIRSRADPHPAALRHVLGSRR